MERLGQWIQRKVEEGRWRVLKTSRTGPELSHLFFTDDLLLFSEARDDQVFCIKEGLRLFCKASGQRVNFNKSLMYCSPNISKQDVTRLSADMGIPLTKELGKYLGHHINHRGSNHEEHQNLMQRVNNHL